MLWSSCCQGAIYMQSNTVIYLAGAFLMDDLPLVERIVRTCAQGLDVPVTCKIRMFPDLQKTVAYAQMLERAGASLIAVHGRLREQKKSKGADANWDVIKVIALLRSWILHIACGLTLVLLLSRNSLHALCFLPLLDI